MNETCNCARECWYCKAVNREVEGLRDLRDALFDALEAIADVSAEREQKPHQVARKAINEYRKRAGYSPKIWGN